MSIIIAYAVIMSKNWDIGTGMLTTATWTYCLAGHLAGFQIPDS